MPKRPARKSSKKASKKKSITSELNSTSMKKKEESITGVHIDELKTEVQIEKLKEASLTAEGSTLSVGEKTRIDTNKIGESESKHRIFPGDAIGKIFLEKFECQAQSLLRELNAWEERLYGKLNAIDERPKNTKQINSEPTSTESAYLDQILFSAGEEAPVYKSGSGDVIYSVKVFRASVLHEHCDYHGVISELAEVDIHEADGMAGFMLASSAHVLRRKDVLQRIPSKRVRNRYDLLTKSYLTAFYLRENQSVKAEGLANLILEEDELSEEDILAKANVKLLKGQYDEAIELAKQVLQKSPNFPEAHVCYGDLKTLYLDYESALAAYNRALELHPNDPVALKSKARVLFFLDKPGESLAILEGMHSIFPHYPEAILLKAAILASLDRNEEALSLLSEISRLHKDYYKPFFFSGLILEKIGKKEAALDAYEQAAVLAPNNGELQFNRGYLLHMSGRIADAIKAYRKALDISPRIPEWHLALGVAYHEKEMYEKALTEYLQTIDQLPEDLEAKFNMGIVLYDLGRENESLDVLKEVITMHPDWKADLPPKFQEILAFA